MDETALAVPVFAFGAAALAGLEAAAREMLEELRGGMIPDAAIFELSHNGGPSLLLLAAETAARARGVAEAFEGIAREIKRRHHAAAAGRG